MKKSVLIIAIFTLLNLNLAGQVNLDQLEDNKTYVINTHDGAEFIGRIISHNAKEVIIKLKDMGEVSVPTYQLKKVKALEKGDMDLNGNYMKDNVFATRYFLTTNGLDVKKGESYVLLNWYGPDIQYGVDDNLTVGLMTSWIGSPVIATIKYSFKLNETNSIGIGALAGTFGWTSLDVGGALPFVSYTVGDRKTNLSISAGYGALWTEGIGQNVTGDALFSLAGMSRVSNKLSLVFDSFIVPGFSSDSEPTIIAIPGIRFQSRENIALQLGIAGIAGQSRSYYEDETDIYTYGLPMAQLFLKF